jgi:protein-S-isoprenylcysteine O-methyltransferase Ste14
MALPFILSRENDILLGGLFGMTHGKTTRNVSKKLREFIIVVTSMAGYVPKNATILRTILMLSSFVFSLYLVTYQPLNSNLAFAYFIFSETLYVGFISSVLAENGLRHWFLRRWSDENKGFKAYQTALGFLFFHNALSIGYVASSTPDGLFQMANKNLILIMAVLTFIGGFAIKVWAAKTLSIEIYYFKDMFLGRRISQFVVTGPYKYFDNPTYGIGQLPAYATAIWYGSKHGLIVGFLNQFLIFSFYFIMEKRFIKRVYFDAQFQPNDLPVQSKS